MSRRRRGSSTRSNPTPDPLALALTLALALALARTLALTLAVTLALTLTLPLTHTRQLDALKTLLEHKADPNAKDAEGMVPLMEA